MSKRKTALLTLIALGLMAFQPVTPTPTLPTPLPTPATDYTGQIVTVVLAAIGNGLVLLYAFGRGHVAREAVITRMADQALSASEDARKSREAADEAKTAASEYKKEATALRTDLGRVDTLLQNSNGENTALRGTVKLLEDRVKVLEDRDKDHSLELKEKDRIIAAQVVEIARLNEDRMRFATASIPAGAAPQASLQGAEVPPIPVVIQQPADDPVPIIETAPIGAELPDPTTDIPKT